MNTTTPIAMENNFLSSIKQFPAYIFGSLNQNNNSSESYPLLKIQIQRIEITHNIKIPDFSPYIAVKIGSETRKTITTSQRDPYNAIFNEKPFEFKNVPIKNNLQISLFHKSNFLFSDKYIGHSSLSLDNPLLINFRKLTLLNENEKNDKLIGYLYLKISFEAEMQIGLENKNSNSENHFIKEKGKKAQEERIYNLSKGGLLLPGVGGRKIEGSQFDLKEIENIYYELFQEKKKLRLSENKLKKYTHLFTKKELQLEEEKAKIQLKKDLLTEEENSLVSEKEKCKEKIKMINKEKESYIESQNLLKEEISRLETTNIKHKLRGDILLKKLVDQTKFMNEANEQILGASDTFPHMTEKLSYVTMSYIDPGNLNEEEISSHRQEERLLKQNEKTINFKKERKNKSVELLSVPRKNSSVDLDGRKTKKINEEEKHEIFNRMKEEQSTQKKLVAKLGATLKEEKKVFENYQKFLKINPDSYTASSNLFQNQYSFDVVKKENNTFFQNLPAATFSFSRTASNFNTERGNFLDENEKTQEKQEIVKSRNSYLDPNRYKSADSFLSLDQYAQPFSLNPVEYQTSNEELSNIKRDPSYKNINSWEHAFKKNEKGTNLPINSSQLFNEYFIKNNLNK